MKTIHNTAVNPGRKYVIVCNEHSGMWAGCVLFWGQLTADGEKRSFGGYTTGIDRCERYTLDEIIAFSTNFAVYRPGMTYEQFRQHRDIIIEHENLEKLGLSTMQVWYRP